MAFPEPLHWYLVTPCQAFQTYVTGRDFSNVKVLLQDVNILLHLLPEPAVNQDKAHFLYQRRISINLAALIPFFLYQVRIWNVISLTNHLSYILMQDEVNIFEPPCDKTNKMVCVPSEDSD